MKMVKSLLLEGAGLGIDGSAVLLEGAGFG
jgi:hypothetical protein